MSREEIVGKRRNRELCPFRLADLRTAKNRISGKTAPSEAGTLIISPPRIFAKKHIFNRPEQFWVMDDKVRGRRFVL